MWFGVDVLVDEPWTIAVRDIHVDGNLLQTAVGDRNVERRRRDTSVTKHLGAERSRYPPSQKSPPAEMPDEHRHRICFRW